MYRDKKTLTFGLLLKERLLSLALRMLHTSTTVQVCTALHLKEMLVHFFYENYETDRT